MSAPNWRIARWIVPVMMVSLGCTAGRPVLIGDSISTDRMMAIGQTFERQGRFAEAQCVYQQVLDQDPVSPAAERLLAVIAAADVTEAQNLPVERLMAVGQFYERHGDLALAQGVYHQILHRDPGFRPAKARLETITAHQNSIASQVTPRGVQVGRSPARATPNSAGLLAKGSSDRGSEDRPASGTKKDLNIHAQTHQAPSTWQPRRTLTASTEQDSLQSDGSNTAYELPSRGVQETPENHRRVLQTSGQEAGPDTRPAEAPIPASPGNTIRTVPSTDQDQQAGAKADNRVSELWQDKPLGQLKASIALKFPETEQLRDTELQRLTQATPHLLARGTLNQTIGQTRPWMLTSYEWEAPATRHLPLWFEEPNLERMGYTCGMQWNVCGYESGPYAAECLQPFVSAGHFFGRVPFIPYMCGINPPCEPIYTLGVDRPGSPVPYRRHLIPVTLKAALYQAGAMVGVAYAVP